MWPELDRQDADRRVVALAAALAAYGLGPGRAVAVVAPPGPDSLVGLCAAGLCGARALLVDPGANDGVLSRVLGEARAAFVLAGGEATLRRVVDLRPDLESLELVFALVAPAADAPPLPAMSVASLVEGDPVEASDLPDDPGFDIVASDGKVLRWPAAELARGLGELAGRLALTPGDTVLVRLLPSDPGWAPAVGAALARQSRVVLDAPGDGGLESALAAHRPTVVFAPTREIDGCRAAWEAGVSRRSWFFRKGHAWALEKGASPETRPWALRLADRLALDSYRERSGGRVRRIVALGGPPDPATTRFFSAIRIPLEGSGG